MKLRINVSALQEIINPGDGIPSWYGVAWIEPGGWNAVCYPYGLHIAVRWLMLLYHAVQLPRRTWWEKRLMDARDEGYDRGVVIGKSMVARIDDKQVFSRSQLNRHIAVAVDTANSIKRLPNDEAYKLGYRIGQAELKEQYSAEFQDASDPQVRPMTKLEGTLMDAQAEVGRLEGLLRRIAEDHNDGRALTGETAKLYREWCRGTLAAGGKGGS